MGWGPRDIARVEALHSTDPIALTTDSAGVEDFPPQIQDAADYAGASAIFSTDM